MRNIQIYSVGNSNFIFAGNPIKNENPKSDKKNRILVWETPIYHGISDFFGGGPFGTLLGGGLLVPPFFYFFHLIMFFHNMKYVFNLENLRFFCAFKKNVRILQVTVLLNVQLDYK